MSKKGGDAPMPTPINPQALLGTQSALNKEAIKLSADINAMDRFGPQGSVTYVRDANGIPRAQYTTLTPTGQNIWEDQQSITRGIADNALGRVETLPTAAYEMTDRWSPTSVDTSRFKQFDAGTLPYDPRAYGNMDAYSQRTADALYDKTMTHLRPEFEQQTRRTTQMLDDRGFPMGGEAANSTMGNLWRSQNEAQQQAARDAVLAAGQEGRAQIGIEQSLRGNALQGDITANNAENKSFADRVQLEQQLRALGINQDLTARTQDMNEISAMLRGSPALSMPNPVQVPTYQYNAPDAMGAYNAAYQQQLQAYQAQQAQNASLWQGIGNLAGTGATLWMMCSRAFKENVGGADSFLSRVRAIPIHTWRYTADAAQKFGLDRQMHVGPFAEDWSKQFGGPDDALYIPDVLGVLIKTIQELDKRVLELEAEVESVTEQF